MPCGCFLRARGRPERVRRSSCVPGVGPDGELVGEGEAYAQARQALANIEAALRMAGAGLEDVVQTRLYVTDIGRWEEVGRAHAEAFGEIRPVTAMVEVARLIDRRMLVEIEAVAYHDRGG